MPFYKGHTHTLRTREKLSIAGKGRIPWNKGLKMSPEAVEKNRTSHIGYRHTPEQKEKIRRALSDEKSSTWKGDAVSYSGIHKWVNKKLGRPSTCEHCEETNLSGHKIHWANVDHQYRRELSDWIRLCSLCHIKFDKENLNETTT